jgi:hypothetical protein
MAWVTVFVDDAVCGRLPPVSTAWLLLLLLFPPVGWLILLVLALANPRQSEWPGALVAEWRVGPASVAVDLDASRRWVTLRGVAPEFARAVRARQSRSDQPYPAP